MRKKVIIGIAALALTNFAFFTWYKFHYSMDVAESFEVNTPELKHRVLIATQGSDFKDVIVDGIVVHLKQRHTYIKVLDVAALQQVNEDKWNAVVIIHTWENLKPQADAKAYLERVKDLKKVIVLTTSGNGGHKIEGVNAITSASVMTDIPSRILDIKNRLDSILDRDIQK
jgi:hypothetical protein